VERGAALPALRVFAALWQLLGFDAGTLLAALGVTVREAKVRARRAMVLDGPAGAGPFAAFGRGLAAARVEARLTQGALGLAVGCRREYVARMEGGHGLPSLRRFAQLQLVLAFDAGELLGRLGENPPGEPWFAFGQLVAAARVGQELSREDVALMARCEAEHVQKVERGAELPTVLVLARMHKLLGFSGDGVLRAVYRCDERDAA
jgi:transcriptional regulator with XRE-family HTH domain